MKQTNIRHWQYRYSDWLRALDFYKTEINILNERLTEITSKNTHKDVLAQVEHFQNQFILHKENIHSLEHAIRQSVQKISEEAASHTGFISGELSGQVAKEEENFLEEEKTINELRHSFNSFSAEWM